jgi:predicted dehydrogenase
LESGKHVVLEKPFANSSDEAHQLVEIAKRSGKILSVYQNRRYVSDFLTIKEILEKRLLGEVHEYIAHYDRYRAEAKPNAWREEIKPGSGVLYDLGPHLIDQALCFFGLPQTITADIRMQRPHSRVDDYFDIRLDFGFAKVILHAGMLVREHGPRYMIHGTKGSFIKHGEDPQEAALKAGSLPVGEDWGKEPDNFRGLLHTDINGSIIKENYPSKRGNFGNYYKNLYKSIIEGIPSKEKPEHGYNTVRLIELAFESHRKKCTVPCSGLMDIVY